MKKIVFAVIVIFAFIGCSNSPDKEIQGRWEFTKFETPHNPKDSSVVLESYLVFGYLMADVDYVEFTKDKILVIGKKGDTLETYTYLINDDTIINIDKNTDTTKFKFEIDNKKLRLYNEKGALYVLSQK